MNIVEIENIKISLSVSHIQNELVNSLKCAPNIKLKKKKSHTKEVNHDPYCLTRNFKDVVP